MIMDALFLITSELNQYIKQRADAEDNPVRLCCIVDHNGNQVSPKNVIAVTLTSVEEEGVNKAQRPNAVRYDNTYTHSEPEIRLNLFIIVSVRPGTDDNGDQYEQYRGALALLSMVAQFFQSHRYFDQSTINNPKVSNDLKRVIVDLYSVGFENQSYIWSIHGGHYLPSLLYKVSLIHIHEDTTTREVPVVETIEMSADSGGL